MGKGKEPTWLAFIVKSQMKTYAQSGFSYYCVYVPTNEEQGIFFFNINSVSMLRGCVNVSKGILVTNEVT